MSDNNSPEGWSFKSVDDVASVFAGGTPSRGNPEYYNGNIPWVKSGEVNARQIFGTAEHISTLAVRESSTKIAPAGSVLLAMYGATAGQVAKLMVDASLNQAVSAINAKGNLADNDYLIHSLEYNIDELLNRAQGSGQPNLSGQLIKGLKTLFPPLPEQQKIAAILTSVDEVIEKTQAQIDKLKDLKTGMMQQLLTSGVGVDGKPHTEFKDSAVGRIPKGWEVVCVDKVAKVVDSMHLTPLFTDQGKPMVRVTEIRNSEVLDISSAVNVDEVTFNSFSKNYQPKFGDTLIARVGAYFGATAYIGNKLEFCLGQNTASIRPLTIDPEYLFIFLNSESIRSQMEDAVAVGAQPSISLKAIKELKIGLPISKEQRNISVAINSANRRMVLTNDQLKVVKDLKKALMQDRLTGKVRVTAVDG